MGSRSTTRRGRGLAARRGRRGRERLARGGRRAGRGRGGRRVAPRRGCVGASRPAAGQDEEGAGGDDHDEERRHDADHPAEGLVAHGAIVVDGQRPRRVTLAGVGPSQDQTPGDHGRLIDRPASPCPTPTASRLGSDTRAATERQRSRQPACKPPGSGLTPGRPTSAASPRQALSAVIPGLGQLFNRRRRLAALFLIPSLDPARDRASCSSRPSPPPGWRPGSSRPRSSGTLLALNVAAPRLAAGRGRPGVPRHPADRVRPAGSGSSASSSSPSSWSCPHLAVYRYGTILGDTFGQIFSGDAAARGRRSGSATARPRPTASGSTSC